MTPDPTLTDEERRRHRPDGSRCALCWQPWPCTDERTRLLIDDPTLTDEELVETCQGCGSRYLTVYRLPDHIWAMVTPGTGGGGLLCPKCADARIRDRGLTLYWEAAVGSYPTDVALPADEELAWAQARLGGQTGEEATIARRLIAALRAKSAEVERLSDELNRCHYTLSMAGVDLGDYGEPSDLP